jgi:PncC family amidohydrolase
MDKTLITEIRKISAILIEKNLRLSIAESCTGGFISNAVTNIPGSSKFFDSGIISYSENSKKSVLGVKASVLRKYGVISEETAIAMAESVKRITCSDVSLSTTGIAGPDSIEGKQVGLICMAVSTSDLTESKKIRFTGSRETIKKQASLEALKFLHQVLRVWI